MNILALGLSVSPEKINGLVKVLAVLGGAVLGGLLVGLLAQLLSRALTTQKLPRWPMFITRLLGAVVGGWLVALWVFGGGGGGIGGPGGWGFGSGTGGGTQQKPEDHDGNKGGQTAPAAAATLRVEVLGDSALRKIKGGAGFDRARRYRVEGKEGLKTLAEVQKVVGQRRSQEPPLRRLEVVLYGDSPDASALPVSNLLDWARELPLEVAVSTRNEDAPTR